MPDLVVLMPLAQLNASSGGAASAPAVERAVAPAAPAPSAPAAGGTATGPAVGTTAITGAPGSPTTQEAKPAGPLAGILQFLPIILMLGALYFFMIRGQRKDEKRRKGLIADLKKGDKIMTIGGMIAKVVSIDGDEVVLKVDESANVKATYRKSAIQEVLGDSIDRK